MCLFLRSQARAQPERSLAKVNDDSKYVFPVQEVLFEVPLVSSINQESKIPKIRQILSPNGKLQHDENLEKHELR